MKDIKAAIMDHIHGQGDLLVKPIAAKEAGENIINITFEITEHVGTHDQTTHTETASFEIVNDGSDIYPARTWYRLDEIDDTSLDAHYFAESLNAKMKDAAYKEEDA